MTNYSLIYVEKKTGENHVIPFKGVKTDLTLMQIDSYTSKFSDETELREELKSLGYKFPDYGYFTIQYKHSGDRRVDLVFNDMKQLIDVIGNNNIESSKINQYENFENCKNKSTVKDFFKSEINYVADVIHDHKELIDFVNEHGKYGRYISQELLSAISRYLEYKKMKDFEKDAQESLNDNINMICSMLKSYKEYRGLEICLKHYKMKQAGLEVPENRTLCIEEERETKENYDKYLEQQAALIKKQAKEATQDTEYMVDEKGQGLLFNPDEFNYMGHESGSTLGKRK